MWGICSLTSRNFVTTQHRIAHLLRYPYENVETARAIPIGEANFHGIAAYLRGYLSRYEILTKGRRLKSMNYEEIIRRLREPFNSREIEWKIQVTSQDKQRGMAVAYMDARAVQKRLDETVGPFNWKNVYSLWHDNSQICGISIFYDERKEWVTKFDGAENSDFEPIKGGLSDSFKRAASVWGIGRYLYEMEGVWVEIEARGKSFVIKQNEYVRLEREYNAMLNRIFGARQAQQGNPSGQAPAANTRQTSAASASNTRQAQTASAANARQTQAAPTANSRQTQAMNTAANAGQAAASPAYDYQVRSIRPSGKSSQFLEMVDRRGGVVKAYIRATDQSIKAGACLNNVQIEKKNGNYGEYNLISAYQLAA